MNRRAVLLGLAMTACMPTRLRPAPAAAPPDEVSRLQGLDSQAFSLATSLCDTAGPRFSGTPGSALAVTWAVETMTKLPVRSRP